MPRRAAGGAARPRPRRFPGDSGGGSRGSAGLSVCAPRAAALRSLLAPSRFSRRIPPDINPRLRPPGMTATCPEGQKSHPRVCWGMRHPTLMEPSTEVSSPWRQGHTGVSVCLRASPAPVSKAGLYSTGTR